MPPDAEEFLSSLLASLPDLPPDLARRLQEVLKQDPAGRAQAIRQIFEDIAGD
jgi:hypothetical protein